MNINEFYAVRLSEGWDNNMLYSNDGKMLLIHDKASDNTIIAQFQTTVFDDLAEVIRITHVDSTIKVTVQYDDGATYTYDFTKIRLSTVL